MTIEITATGPGLPYLEPNAQALGIQDPDRLTPDPVLLLSRFVQSGFAEHGDETLPGPRWSIRSQGFDQGRRSHHWHLDAAHLDRGLLRVLGNLMRSAGIDDFDVTLVEPPSDAARFLPGDLQRLGYPQVAPPRAVAWSYKPPDEDDIVRNRSLRIEVAAPFDAALMDRIRNDLDVWIEITCRSGYCPANEDPANSGALPTFAYALDPQTMAVDFDGIFLVDEACFEPIAAYLHRLAADGVQVRAVEIA